MGKFKLRLKVYEARKYNEELYSRLVYHKWFNEELSVQLTNYAYSPQNDIYKSQNNILSLRELEIHTQYLIIETHFSLIPLRLVKRGKDNFCQVNIIPNIIPAGKPTLETPLSLFSSSGLLWADCYPKPAADTL